MDDLKKENEYLKNVLNKITFYEVDSKENKPVLDLVKENKKLKKENELLKEQVKIIKEDITAVYQEMVSLDIIHKVEIDDDVELL